MKDFKVRCVSTTTKCFTEGKVYDVSNGTIYGDNGSSFNTWGRESMRRKADFEHLNKWFKPYATFELAVEDKIVITTDGKTTTATLYRDNEKVTAEAKCSPEDKFDFITGAKLAMHRLVEKTEEVIIHGFKLGERVHYKGHNGTVICFSPRKVGVEFDTDFERNGFSAHNCEVVHLLAGKRGTKYTSHWIISKELHHGETKCYNGKVVCVKKGYADYITIPTFTVGKVYEVVDGVITDDEGWTSGHIESIETIERLCACMGNTFIPLVE